MRTTPRLVVVLLSLPFLVGCFGVMQVPVPRSLPDRQALDLRGVVVQEPDDGSEEVLRFEELHDVTWTTTSLSIVADVEQNGSTQTVTRLIPITELSAVLVRQLDAGRTSALIGGVVVGGIAVLALILTGDAATYGL